MAALPPPAASSETRLCAATRIPGLDVWPARHATFGAQRYLPRRPDVEPAGKRLEVDCFTSASPSCRPLASVGHLYARSLLTSLAPDGLQSLAQSGRRRTSSAGCLIQCKALLGAAGQARRAGESLGRRSPRYSQSSRGGGCFGDAQVRRPASHCRRYGGERGGLQKIWPPTSRPSSP